MSCSFLQSWHMFIACFPRKGRRYTKACIWQVKKNTAPKRCVWRLFRLFVSIGSVLPHLSIDAGEGFKAIASQLSDAL